VGCPVAFPRTTKAGGVRRAGRGTAWRCARVDARSGASDDPPPAGRTLAPVRLAITPVLLDRDPTLSNNVFNFGICRR